MESDTKKQWDELDEKENIIRTEPQQVSMVKSQISNLKQVREIGKIDE